MHSTNELQKEINNLSVQRELLRHSIRYRNGKRERIQPAPVEYLIDDVFLSKSKESLAKLASWDNPEITSNPAINDMFNMLTSDILSDLKTVQRSTIHQGPPGYNFDEADVMQPLVEQKISRANALKAKYIQSGPEAVKEEMAAIIREKIVQLELKGSKYLESHSTLEKYQGRPSDIKKLELQMIQLVASIDNLEDLLKTMVDEKTETSDHDLKSGPLR